MNMHNVWFVSYLPAREFNVLKLDYRRLGKQKTVRCLTTSSACALCGPTRGQVGFTDWPNMERSEMQLLGQIRCSRQVSII